MDFIKVRFKKDFDQDYSEFERAFDDMFRSMSPIFTLSQRSWKPPMDIYETEDEIYILAELAGAENDEINIEVTIFQSSKTDIIARTITNEEIGMQATCQCSQPKS